MKKLYTVLCSVISCVALAQFNYYSIDKDKQHLLDRYKVLNHDDSLSTTSPLNSIAKRPDTGNDIFNESLNYLYTDQWDRFADSLPAKKKRKFLYKNPRDFFHYKGKSFSFYGNPVILWSYGTESARDVNTFINTRGIEVHGSVDDKIEYYSFIADNQMIVPQYVNNQIRSSFAVPGENFWKRFKKNGYDFFTARGYIAANLTPHIRAQFGQGKHFLGDGYRSLILSDFAGNYTYLKFNTKVWKINYTNLYTDMTGDLEQFYTTGSGINGTKLLPKKFMTMHHLSVALRPNLKIGLFESIVFSRVDTLGNISGYEMGYFNPIIFYRAIEQNLGSQDNALLGMNYRWDFLKHFSFYGQLVIDEFFLREIRNNQGWWANKQALQTGIKYLNAFGIANLDLQVESNIVRPYTFSHTRQETAYTHYGQPLGHPLGANFNEMLAIIRYRPIKKLALTGKLFNYTIGKDSTGTNWGSNITLSNVNRMQDYGNKIGQGIKSQVLFVSLEASYMIKHNFFVDLSFVYRNEDADLAENTQQTSFTSLSLRWNIAKRLHEF